MIYDKLKSMVKKSPIFSFILGAFLATGKVINMRMMLLRYSSGKEKHRPVMQIHSSGYTSFLKPMSR